MDMEDLENAHKYYDIAVKKNHVGALKRLGGILEHKDSFDRRYKRWSIELYQRAVQLGDREAVKLVFNVCDSLYGKKIYSQNYGKKHDTKLQRKEFLEWANRAANLSHAPALFAVGVIYVKGACGVTKNLNSAKIYFDKAVEIDGIKMIDKIIYHHWYHLSTDLNVTDYFNKGAELLGLPLVESGEEIPNEHLKTIHDHVWAMRKEVFES